MRRNDDAIKTDVGFQIILQMKLMFQELKIN